MTARRPGPLALLPRRPLARLAVLLWLLACVLGAPGAATLHVLLHVAAVSAGNRQDAPPASHHDEQCDLCAAWHELGSALPSAPPVVPAAAPRAAPPAVAAVATPDTSAPRWFHPRAPPIQA
ncbi:DUF2946 family protein [Bordetella genomosp. 13]|uniref:DUF2946 family protein n=1 Tax=Bordetella genomosp. 13 TaxID=463040 RepID=UPI0011A6440F|nr:DUF2946 family protein [Bordetella genomosp. 13]